MNALVLSYPTSSAVESDPRRRARTVLRPSALPRSSSCSSRPGAGGQHLAFALTRVEFDEVFERLRAAGIAYGDSFHSVGNLRGPGDELGARGLGKALYLFDPSKHLIEIRHYDTREFSIAGRDPFFTRSSADSSISLGKECRISPPGLAIDPRRDGASRQRRSGIWVAAEREPRGGRKNDATQFGRGACGRHVGWL